MAVKHSTYRTNFLIIVGSLLRAIFLAWKHFKSAIRRNKILPIEDPSYFKQKGGVVTTLYPYESIPVPDHGRYRLHNEIDDCIVCDLCAKVCPVNCITIDPIKSTEEIGKTSDGSTKRIYAATFNIDMAQCCYCGLCTTVCPTECLTMTKAYDYSEYDVRNMVYHFADLSPEESVVKRKEWDEAQLAKQAAKANPATEVKTESSGVEGEVPAKPKPFIPKAMPPKVSIPVKKPEGDAPALPQEDKVEEAPKPKPYIPKAMPPKVIIPVKKPEGESPENPTDKTEEAPAAKPKVVIPPKVIIPVKKIEPSSTNAESASTPDETPKQRAVPPKVKIPMPKKKDDDAEKGGTVE
jgi:formate hydrogenlyase subunit 6/NADH:ubiquinone oxidoreductase subunit I